MPEAYQLYLQGLFYWNKWTQSDFKKAAGLFHSSRSEGINITRCVLRRALPGTTYSLLGGMRDISHRQKAWPGKQKAAAMQALEIDDSLGGKAHTSSGAL